MKSNFDFIKILKDKKILSFDEFNSLNSLINNFEKSIHYRRGNYIKLDMRYLYEALWGMIINVLEDNVDKQEELGVRAIFKNKNLAIKGNKKFWQINNKLTLSRILHPSSQKDILPLDKYNFLKNTYKEIHGYVHFNFENNDVFIQSHKKVRNILRVRTISFTEMIKFSHFFYYLILFLIEDICDLKFKKKPSFKEEVYSDGSKCWNAILNRDEVQSKLNNECKICNKGKLQYPNDKRYEYGPYLKCDNNNCEAKLSTNLNLKKTLNKECKNCKLNDSNIRETYSYSTNEKYYDCISCGFKELN